MAAVDNLPSYSSSYFEPPPVEPSPPTPATSFNHTVESGETLSELSARYQVTVPALVAENPDLAGDLNLLRVGQDLRIPLGPEGGTRPDRASLAPGQTLAQLAHERGTSPFTLRVANRHELIGGNTLEAGETVWVPKSKVAEPPQPDAAQPVATQPAAETPQPVTQTTEQPQPQPTTAPLAAKHAIEPTAQPTTQPATAPTPRATSPTGPTAPASSPVKYSVSLLEHKSRSATATAVSLAVKAPLDASSTVKVSVSAIHKLPDQGAGVQQETTRVGVEFSRRVHNGPQLSVDATMGVNGWVVHNLDSAGPKVPDTRLILLPTADLSAKVQVGAGIDVHAKVGGWGAIDPDPRHPVRTVATYAQGGVGVSVGGVQVSEDLRAQTEVRDNVPDANYRLSIFDASVKLGDHLSTNLRWSRTLGGEVKGATIDFPQGEHHEDKITWGVTGSF